MVWHRLPTYLPSFLLRLLPLSQTQRAAYEATGFVKDLVFKTVPRVGKVNCFFFPGLPSSFRCFDLLLCF